MAKSVFVEQLTAGASLDSEFVITSANVHEYSKGHRLMLRLADRTGKVDAVKWDVTPDAARAYPPGTLVTVTGSVGTHQGKLQVNVESLTRRDPSSVDERDFVPLSPRDPAEMEGELRALVAGIGHPGLRAACEAFLADAVFEIFRTLPGGKRWHHSYRHGLLEHTLSVMGLCARFCDHYDVLNRDLLLTAALLHDLGKVKELTGGLANDYTAAGRLLGHQVMTIPMASKYLSHNDAIPPRLALEVLHTIAAHHGEQEGSIVRPMTREAAALHFADHLDATMNAWSREIEQARRGEQEFTGFINLINRFLYVGVPPDSGDDLPVG